MTSVRQVALLPAGSQPWNLHMVAGKGPKFAYCASLAVYVYEVFIQFHNQKALSLWK